MPDSISRTPTPAEAARLRACLTSAQYEEALVCERLGIGSVVAVQPLHAPHYLMRLGNPDLQAALIRLFLLQRPVPAAELRPAFAEGDLNLLAELGLVERQGEALAAQVDLSPYAGDWLATDRSDRAADGGLGGRYDAVMPLNMSSRLLAQLVLPVPVDSVLDVGTGCGVHAIRAARQARHVIATDLNPRALRFAAFNAALNGVPNIEFRMGNLWEPVRGEAFDLILANPAFSLSAQTEFLYRDGGDRGDRMTGALLAGAVEYLREGGVAQVIGEFPTIGESGFEEQVEGWVGDRSEAIRPLRGHPGACDLLLLRLGATEPLEYAVAYAHQPFGQKREEYEAALGARLAHFRALGVRDVVLGAVVLRRRAVQPHWTARRVLPVPECPIGRAIVALMAVLDRWECEEAPQRLWEGVPCMVSRLRLTETRARSPGGWEEAELRVGVPGDVFCQDLRLSGPARDLLVLCDGTRRGNEIAAEFARLHHLAAGEAAEATVAFLRELAEQGLIELHEGEASVPPSRSGETEPRLAE